MKKNIRIFVALFATILFAATLFATTFTSATNGVAAEKNVAGEKSGDSKPVPLEKGWIRLFNGKDLTGWKIGDEQNSKWRVKDGCIVANSKRSHLFTEKEFKNFEFKADVKTTPGSNSGIYFHTRYLKKSWPIKYGFEAQVNSSHVDPVLTGSLYNIVKLYQTPAKDNEWHEYYIMVKGNKVIIKINGKKVLEYVEPPGVTGNVRKLGKGCFALQAHDPKSLVYFRNIRVKPLDD